MTGSDGLSQASVQRALVFRLLERFCAEHGLVLTAGDPHGHAGMVENTAGKRRYFVGARFGLNNQSAAEIADDKAYSAHFLAQNGIPVPEWLFLPGDELSDKDPLPERLVSFAQQHGFPLFAKPVTGQEGKDVVRIDSPEHLQKVLAELVQRHDRLLVQQAVSGREFRVLVLDDEVLCLFERLAPAVIGDGEKTIAELVSGLAALDPTDDRFKVELLRQDLSLHQVPEPGRRIELLPVRNLSSGGTAILLDANEYPGVADTARAAARALSLRYAGVDLLLGKSDAQDHEALVLEVNAAPGLSNLARLGQEEAALVEAIYQRVFQAAFLEN